MTLRVTAPIDPSDRQAAEDYTKAKLAMMHEKAGPYWQPKDLSEHDMSYLSRLGEIGFGKLLDLKPNPDPGEPDDGIDFFWNGIGIDVKTICKPKGSPSLLVWADKLNGTNGKTQLKADVLVLNEVVGDEVIHYGWCSLRRFRHEARNGDFGYGPTYYIEEWELSAFRDLWVVLKDLQVADF